MGQGVGTLEKNGKWRPTGLTLESESQSQTVGLGMGLLPDIYLWRCWELPTPAHKNSNIFPPWNPLPFPSKSSINPPSPIWNYPQSSLHLLPPSSLKAFMAKIRGLALPIKDSSCNNLIPICHPPSNPSIITFKLYHLASWPPTVKLPQVTRIFICTALMMA